MIDIRRLRADPEGVKAALARRSTDLDEIDRAIELDEQSRKWVAERDGVRNRIKTTSREVGALRKAGDVVAAETLQAESRALGERESELDELVDRLEAELRVILLNTPNLPSEDAPDGAGPEDNPVVRVVGYREDAYGPHQRVPHWDIGAELGILDLERAAKLSGSMFTMLRGAGAMLSRALIQFALDLNSDLYEEIRPPTLVRTDTMVSTGHLPKFVDEAYHLERDDLWAIPTAEVPLTSLARDEVIPEADLPVRLMAHTACFRREAGSAGRDTRGLLRVHEFDKVEILAYATPDQAQEMHAELLERAERSISSLDLAYRVVDLCTGDLGNSSARTFDLEVYAPGCDQWLEVSSVSWFSDYQARRANVRYRPADGGGTQFVHTFNGSALAVPRVWAAVVETHRQPDGTISIPEVLRPYTRGATHISR